MRIAFFIIAVLFASCGTETQSNSNSPGPGTGPAAVAINSVIAANERAAITNLRAIHGAQMTFQSTNGSYGNLKQLGESGALPPSLAQGVSGSYRFEITKAENQTFEAVATPIEYGRTGRRSFFIDESGKIRGADKNGAAANVNDASVEQ
jgi:hypothetical protein